MQTDWLVPLAQPRGLKRRCELCLGPATVRCAGCGVTYYCDVDHQHADWVSIHEKICQLLIPLRTAPPFYNSDKERKLGQEQKRSREIFLAGVTYDTAQNFLFEGNHEDAIPAALHSLKFSISIHGPNSVELVPAYLVLAETSLGLGHLSQGEEYLSQAHWIVLKNAHCSCDVQAKLHQNLGLLHAAKGNLDDSLYHLANNVVNIWYDHFNHLIDIQYQKLITPAEIDLLSEERGTEENVLDEKQQAEATQMLNPILEFREQSPKPRLEKMAKLFHTLAMFYYLIHDLPKADEFVMKVLQATEHLPEHEPDESLYHLVKLIKSKAAYAK
ncbi:zinc finger MYND domain-containing protein 12 isoform 2-T2 [Liasis olivaceus]